MLRPPPPVRMVLLSALLVLLGAGSAAPATYYVDVATGVNDASRDGLTPATAWKNLTFAVGRLPVPGPHEVVVAAGEYTEANGESFPLTIPPDVSVTGAGPDLTSFHDDSSGSAGTLRWAIRTGQVPADIATFKDFTILRDRFLGQFTGSAFELRSFSAVGATGMPKLTNLVLRGAARGLDIFVEGDAANATLAPAVEACRFLDNGNGVLSTAYTVTGATTRSDPAFLNCVAMKNAGEGMVFETQASWDIQSGQRSNAVSAPIVTHCTMAENLGSGILIDNSNGYLTNRIYWAGSVAPRVTNSVLTGNGDYALHEYTSACDPAAFDRNLVGGNLVALYRNEGTTDEVNISGVPGSGNLAAAAAFQRSLLPDFHLRGDSPGIDRITTGFAATDADFEARPVDSDGVGGAAAEMGADEATPCAVNAIMDPAAPADRCGLAAPLVLSAATSAMAAGFTCSQPLLYTWYADGIEFATTPDVAVVPPATTTYSVVVRCPDFPHCSDARTATVVVHSLPDVDAEAGVSGTPTGDYEACIAWDAADVTVDLAGTATATEDSAAITGQSWSSADGILLGGASLMPQLAVTNTGQSQDIAISLTATDSHSCENTSFSRVHVWRGPQPLPGGPYSACQDVGNPQTFVPLDGAADLATGSVAASWLWRTDVGQFEDSNASTSTLEDPRLKLTNFPFNRTANLTLSVTDDKGCTDDAATSLTLYWTPGAPAGGPYQEPEAVPGPTLFSLLGTATGPPGATLSWTTDLGTFQSTGTQAADGAAQVLEVVSTGSDQLGQACLTVTTPSGVCPAIDCTAVSVRTTPLQPPHDVGPSFRIDEVSGTARLSWANPPIDATHDRAELFDVWEAALPSAGNWTPRPGLQDVPRTAGTVSVDDPTLLDVAGPDLIYLLVVSENGGGFSCSDPAAQLPDCPSLEDCGNGTDDDEDRLVDCADPGCAGVPPC